MNLMCFTVTKWLDNKPICSQSIYGLDILQTGQFMSTAAEIFRPKCNRKLGLNELTDSKLVRQQIIWLPESRQ